MYLSSDGVGSVLCILDAAGSNANAPRPLEANATNHSRLEERRDGRKHRVPLVDETKRGQLVPAALSFAVRLVRDFLKCYLLFLSTTALSA